MSYSVSLEIFEGPLDLLLKLIDDNQVDIYDIPIALITDQYLEYLEKMAEIDLDVLADFLVMAATLLRIKSRMLVPRHYESDENGEEAEEDPRAELVRQLVEYRKFKSAADHLRKLEEGCIPRVYYREEEIIEQGVEVRASLTQLLKAFEGILKAKPGGEVSFELPQGDIDIAEKMEEIVTRLEQSRHGLILQDLFISAASKREALAMFLALLELIRLEKVRAVQIELFGPITVRLVRSVPYAG